MWFRLENWIHTVNCIRWNEGLFITSSYSVFEHLMSKVRYCVLFVRDNVFGNNARWCKSNRFLCNVFLYNLDCVSLTHKCNTHSIWFVVKWTIFFFLKCSCCCAQACIVYCERTYSDCENMHWEPLEMCTSWRDNVLLIFFCLKINFMFWMWRSFDCGRVKTFNVSFYACLWSTHCSNVFFRISNYVVIIFYTHNQNKRRNRYNLLFAITFVIYGYFFLLNCFKLHRF